MQATQEARRKRSVKNRRSSPWKGDSAGLGETRTPIPTAAANMRRDTATMIACAAAGSPRGDVTAGASMPATRLSSRFWPLLAVTMGVLGLVSTCRALGFGEGIILGATPASGLALGAAVVLRTPGAVAAAVGFAVAGFIWGLSPGVVATEAVAHGTAALVAALVMRALARRREVKTKTNQWLIFLVGVSVFTTVVAAGLLGGGASERSGHRPHCCRCQFSLLCSSLSASSPWAPYLPVLASFAVSDRILAQPWASWHWERSSWRYSGCCFPCR